MSVESNNKSLYCVPLNFFFIFALVGVAQLVGASSHKPKDLEFGSQSGYLPWLQV